MKNVVLIEGVRRVDDRGSLTKLLDSSTLGDRGIEGSFDELLTTSNRDSGTLRGLHYQVAPFQQAKTVWVSHGSLFDVLVDLREDEPTFGAWASLQLSGDDDLALHVPPGVAHGYLTLEDDTRVTYLIRGRHSPAHARTLRWDDATVGVVWPRPVVRMSPSDANGQAWPPLS